MSQEITEEQEAAGNKRINEFINSLPESDSIVFAMTSQHLPWGATWGYDTDINGGVRASKRAASESNGKVVTFDLLRGTVTEYIDSDALLNNYRKLISLGGLNLPDSVIQNAKKRRNDAMASLNKFLAEGNDGQVGFFNTNQSDTVTKDGVTYPSFCLNVRDFLGLAGKYNYDVVTSKGTRLPAREAFVKMVGFMSELEKSPSSNSVFVTLKKAK